MLAGSALAYLRRYAVAVGRDVVVFANNDLGWETAAALAQGGMKIRAVLDPRGAVPEGPAHELAQRGTECLTGHVVIAAKGRKSLKSLDVSAFDRHSRRLTGPIR